MSSRRRVKKKKNRHSGAGRIAALVLLLAVLAAAGLWLWHERPQAVLARYYKALSAGDYEKMYAMVRGTDGGSVDRDTFLARNKNIYTGIEAKNITISDVQESDDGLTYTVQMDTVAGQLSFVQSTALVGSPLSGKIAWADDQILPDLTADERVSVVHTEPQRGQILDRSGSVLAGNETDEDGAVRRIYPDGVATAHLIGYVQSVTADDLKKHSDGDYTSRSVIGRSGLEAALESTLRGTAGARVDILDANGAVVKTVVERKPEDGSDVKLTIDASLQNALYATFSEDRGCSVALNPLTGEVLALVSTPSYDINDFLGGMSDEEWSSLTADEDSPLMNRFTQTWAPGSTFKSITAAIGLESGKIDPDRSYESEGTYKEDDPLAWQLDSTWGTYYVTTLHEYSPVNLRNALIYSDNIYFARAALRIGSSTLGKYLDRMDFGKKLDFPLTLGKSQYANSGSIADGVQLADSGYGQGQVLVNPVHLASIYTMFLNGGSILKPVLLYEENPKAQVLCADVISDANVQTVLEDLEQVVNNENGTGYGAHRSDILLAGKTGTAELKESQEEEDGAENGWFTVFTADRSAAKPVLITSFVQGVQDEGGSAYVVAKDAQVLAQYLQ